MCRISELADNLRSENRPHATQPTYSSDPVLCTLTAGVDHVADVLRARHLAEVLPGEGVQGHVAAVVLETQVLEANLEELQGWFSTS